MELGVVSFSRQPSLGTTVQDVVGRTETETLGRTQTQEVRELTTRGTRRTFTFVGGTFSVTNTTVAFDEIGKPPKLVFQSWHYAFVVVEIIGGYFSLFADLIVAANYISSYGWTNFWIILTFVLPFLPGCVMCVTQLFTYYSTVMPENKLQTMTWKVGEEPFVFEKQHFRLYDYAALCALNLLQVRTLFEGFRSVKFQFITGGFLDCKLLQMSFQNVPQLMLQSYVLFQEWNIAAFSLGFTPTFVCIGLGFFNICLVPAGAPCCEDNRTLIEVGEEDLQQERKVDSSTSGHELSQMTNS